MARGSNCEVQTQLMISAELGFGHIEQRDAANGLSEEDCRMLSAVLKKLEC
jgi:four helix bundle protein